EERRRSCRQGHRHARCRDQPAVHLVRGSARRRSGARARNLRRAGEERSEDCGQAAGDRRQDHRGQGPQVARRDHAARPAVRQRRQADGGAVPEERRGRGSGDRALRGRCRYREKAGRFCSRSGQAGRELQNAAGRQQGQVQALARTEPRSGGVPYNGGHPNQDPFMATSSTPVSEQPASASGLRRILLKLSGEALMGQEDYGVDPKMLKRVALEIREVMSLGMQVAVVIGGGNIFRGAGLARAGMDRVTGDHMGMLATVMNSLAMQDAVEALGLHARVMSAIRINEVCEEYIRRRAVRHLEKGRVCILAAGTGNPFFTTDTAASLRAIEINADVLLKATKVNGIYSDDPMKNPQATRYGRLTFEKVLTDRLNVMDATAIVMCRDNNLPLRVFDLTKPGELLRIVRGEDVGTLVTNS